MAIWDETLPDGRSVYEAVAGLRKPRVSFGAGGLTGIEPPNAPVSTTPQINPNISMRPDAPPAILGPRVSPVIPSNAGLEPPSAGVSIPNPRIDPNKIDFNPYPQDASKSGRLAIDLGAMQGASPRSPIKTTDEGVSVGAPKPKGHGLLNTLKYLGKGAVINMGRIASERAAHGQNASLGELLGAGGAGAAVGGISPISIDQDIANAAIQRKQGELGNQLEIEKQQALIDKAQQSPNAPERHVVGGRIIEKQPDGTWKTVYEPPATEKPSRVGTHVVNGALVDDNGKVIYQSPEKPEKPPRTPSLTPGEEQQYNKRESERQANLQSAQTELQSLINEEEKARQRKDAASAESQRLKSGVGTEEAIAAQQKITDKAQKDYEAFAPKKRDAQAKVTRFSTPEPKISAPTSTPSPKTHVLNKQAWLQSHPASDWPKAVAAAKAQGYQIVE